MRLRQPIWFSAALAVALALPTVGFAQPNPAPTATVDHVLLISVDGLHAVDLEKYIAANPSSTLATLAQRGVRYTKASASTPSDSFPGLMAIVTGGTPRSTGVYYEGAYDRSLVAPGAFCTPGQPNNNVRGTVIDWSEAIDIDLTQLDGGGGINQAALPQDPNTCDRVMPHSYLDVNTIFEVLKSRDLRTAWSDKSLGYEMVNGPSGHGVDDLYTPEINANISVVVGGVTYTSNPTSSETLVQAYDSLKVTAILNEIDGYDHTGTGTRYGTPAVFGMNFQAVSVGQKLENDFVPPFVGAHGGYTDAQGDPTPMLTSGLNFVDQSLGQMVAELKAKHLYDDTAIIITAKHGQSPINLALLRKLGDPITSVVTGAGVNLAHQTADTASLLWLGDRSQTSTAVKALKSAGTTIGISSHPQVLSGADLFAKYGNPATDTLAADREPNIIVTPDLGVLFTTSSKKIADHGGFNHDDTSVAMLISGPNLGGSNAGPAKGRVITTPVTTTQVAPTIALILGVDPNLLDAVQQEHTKVLPVL